MMKRNFLLSSVLGLAAVLLAANASQAQSYFYGYYYPDEHRFSSSKPNMGIYTYSTVTPQWNALHDGDYGRPGLGALVPTGRPLTGPDYYPSRILPSGSGGYDTTPRMYYGQPISAAPAAPAVPAPSIRVFVPDPQAVVYFGDYQTKSTGTERVYQSPAMSSGTYQIKVAYPQGGQQLVQERTINVSPGQSVVLDFRGGTATATNPATTTVGRNDR